MEHTIVKDAIGKTIRSYHVSDYDWVQLGFTDGSCLQIWAEVVEREGVGEVAELKFRVII